MRRRGRTAIIVGSVLTALGVVLFVAGIAVAATQSFSKVDGFQRIKLTDQSGTVKFDKTGGYVAYYESDSVTNHETGVPLIPIRLTDPAGVSTVLTTKYGNRSDGKIKLLHYDYDGHKGLAMWQFHVSKTGSYSVALGNNTSAAPDTVVAFGPSILSAGFVAGGTAIGLGVLLGIAGIVTLIVGLVRRSRHSRELTASAYGGPGGWGAQPGWQQPSAPWQQPQQFQQPPPSAQSWPQTPPPGQAQNPPQQWPQQWPPSPPENPPQQWPPPGQPR